MRRVTLPDHWRQVSFIFFDLGVMNVIGGAGVTYFYSLPLHALGFRYKSLVMGVVFIMFGLASWKVRRLPTVITVAIIAIDLWNTIRFLPKYEIAGGVFLVQISFVLPLCLTLISMVRVRLGLAAPKHEIYSSIESTVSMKGVTALLTSMFASVGSGMAALLLFVRYVMPVLTDSPNPLINMLHDLVLVPALLILFPLGAALGELIWIRLSRFYLSPDEINAFIRYLEKIPIVSRLSRMAHSDSIRVSVKNRLRLKYAAGAALLLVSIASLVFLARTFFVTEVRTVTATTTESLPAPGTLVVSQQGRGQYRTINDAIASANPGATILVRPGIYRETVVIDKDITLTGDQGDSTIQCAEDGCLRITATKATIRNLRVEAKVGFIARLFRRGGAAVRIVNSQPVVEACDVSSNAGAGIVVTGAESMPEIRNTRMHDCKLNGILFTDRAQGVVADSEIYGNLWAGVRADNKGSATIRNSRIRHGNQDGILVDTGGAVSVENSQIFENAYSGVHVREGSSASINQCQIFKHGRGGINVHDRSFVKAEECDISANTSAGVEVFDESDIELLNVKVHNQNRSGIAIWRKSTATIERATVYENGGAGLVIADASPVIRKSVFRSHPYAAIEVRSGADPLIEQSLIYGGGSSGIFFVEGALGTVQDSAVFSNASANIVIASNSNPKILRTSLSESSYAGLLVMEGGRGLISDCQIFNNYMGVEIRQNAAPSIENCTIKNNRHEGIVADQTSGGSVSGSRLSGNSGGAWKVEAGSGLVRNKNVSD